MGFNVLTARRESIEDYENKGGDIDSIFYKINIMMQDQKNCQDFIMKFHNEEFLGSKVIVEPWMSKKDRLFEKE